MGSDGYIHGCLGSRASNCQVAAVPQLKPFLQGLPQELQPADGEVRSAWKDLVIGRGRSQVVPPMPPQASPVTSPSGPKFSHHLRETKEAQRLNVFDHSPSRVVA